MKTFRKYICQFSSTFKPFRGFHLFCDGDLYKAFQTEMQMRSDEFFRFESWLPRITSIETAEEGAFLVVRTIDKDTNQFAFLVIDIFGNMVNAGWKDQKDTLEEMEVTHDEFWHDFDFESHYKKALAAEIEKAEKRLERLKAISDELAIEEEK